MRPSLTVFTHSMSLCGCVAVWLCGCVAVWLCGGCIMVRMIILFFFLLSLNFVYAGELIIVPLELANTVQYEDKGGYIPGVIWQGTVHRICATSDHSSADQFCKDRGYQKGVAKDASNLNLSGETAACVDPLTKVACHGKDHCKGYHRITCLKDSAFASGGTEEDYCDRYADQSVHLGRAIRSSKKCASKSDGKWAGENGPHKTWCLSQTIKAVQKEMKEKYEFAAQNCVE